MGGVSPPGLGQQLQPLPVTRLDERTGIADLDAPHAVSLSISQPIAIKDALLLLVRGTAFSLAVDQAVTGTFAGELKDLTLRQALEAVLFPQSLGYTVDGTVISVHPRRPSMRLFDVSYLNVRRDWQRGIRSGSSLPGQPSSADASSSISGSFFEEIERGVTALLSSDGKAHVDRKNGIVQVTDLQDRLDRIAVYLESVHIRATRQVRIEARVLEVTLTDPAAHAVDWDAVAKASGQPWAAARTPMAGVRVQDFSAVVKALGEQGDVRMLATPHVLAMNNEPAVMRVGTQDVYFTTEETRTDKGTDRRATPSAMMQGFTMTVTPMITADGVVQLSIAPTYTEKTGESKSRLGDRVPVLRVAEADTLVRMRDGESLVLSGMLREETRTTPGEGLAGFFGAAKKSNVKAELIILLSATIVTPGATPATGGR
jgi:MSHA biogenesis protein MshL